MFVEDEFEPGDICLLSGIYTVTHDAVHISAHEVTAVTNDRLPLCYGCADKVRYVLARPAAHLIEQPSLSRGV